MRLRYAILIAALILEFVAAVALLVKAAGNADVEIDEEALAKAEAAHQRRSATRAPPKRLPQRAPEPRTPPPRQTAKAEESEEREERTEPRRPQPTLSTSRAEASDSDEIKVNDVRSPFDRGQFLEALDLAEQYLEKNPDQAYIRRVAVTSACATGKLDTARKYYEQMNDRDKRTSERRCDRWGVEF